MRSVDLYTKAVLTVIACCLLYLCSVSHQPQIVHADTLQHVWIDGASLDARVGTFLTGVYEDSYHPFAIPIRSADRYLPVSIANVGGSDLSWGAIPVMNTNGSDLKVLPLTVTTQR